jgi:transitional endoplasmic reticulum ATPase
MAERISILQLLCSKSNVAEDIDLEQLAQMTERFTGADMQALLRKAGLCALKREQGLQTLIKHQDFLSAIKSLKASVSEEQHLRYSRFAVN